MWWLSEVKENILSCFKNGIDLMSWPNAVMCDQVKKPHSRITEASLTILNKSDLWSCHIVNEEKKTSQKKKSKIQKCSVSDAFHFKRLLKVKCFLP